MTSRRDRVVRVRTAPSGTMSDHRSWRMGGWVGLGGQGGCEWRSEAFVKIQKKKFWGGGGSGQGVELGGGVSGWKGTEN